MTDKTVANAPSGLDADQVKNKVEGTIIQLLEDLGIDWQNDPNTQDTPRRVAKLYVDEILAGRFQARPKMTIFPNTKKLDELYSVGPLPVVSLCSHHFMPVIGNVWIGVVPGKNLLGLSKFARLSDWIFSRPQIQEEAIVQLADELEEVLQPIGLAVICRAEHTCMTLRGTKARDSLMTTSVMRGVMRENAAPREEFLKLLQG